MRPVDAPALAALVASTLLLAGCATRGSWFEPEEPGHPFADPQLMVPAAALLVSQGQAKSEVQARLGAGEMLRFDSGYEVWVYRAAGRGDARTRPELVLLFDPSGGVVKVRARPGYGVGGAAR